METQKSSITEGFKKAKGVLLFDLAIVILTPFFLFLSPTDSCNDGWGIYIPVLGIIISAIIMLYYLISALTMKKPHHLWVAVIHLLFWVVVVTVCLLILSTIRFC